MSEDTAPRDRKLVFASGCLLGAILGILVLSYLLRNDIGTQLLLGTSEISPNNAVANAPVKATDPGHWLRLVQAVGILLPLFTGLLRLTTNEQSGVSEDLNTELVFGITTLVLGGIFAVGGLIVMNTPPILKLALFFILLTFGTIGVAAARIFSETTDEQEAESSILNYFLLLLIRIGRLFGKSDTGSVSDSPREESGEDTETAPESTATPEDAADDE